VPDAGEPAPPAVPGRAQAVQRQTEDGGGGAAERPVKLRFRQARRAEIRQFGRGVLGMVGAEQDAPRAEGPHPPADHETSRPTAFQIDIPVALRQQACFGGENAPAGVGHDHPEIPMGLGHRREQRRRRPRDPRARVDHDGDVQLGGQGERAPAVPAQRVHRVGERVDLQTHEVQTLHAPADLGIVLGLGQVRIRVGDAEDMPGVPRGGLGNRVVLALDAGQAVARTRLDERSINAVDLLTTDEVGFREVLVEDLIKAKVGMGVHDHPVTLLLLSAPPVRGRPASYPGP